MLSALKDSRIRATAALLFTLATLYLVPDRRLVVLVLVAGWWALFRPVSPGELVMFLFASVFFLFQNYVTLREGIFEFRFKDMLLMPYYEPFLWGFYFVWMKRLVYGHREGGLPPRWTAVLAVVLTSVAFTFFGMDTRTLLIATAVSTSLLLILFHERDDIAFALVALALGLVIELYGVWSGLWWYPAPDFLGIPYWFATMWISVGLLGRRFLIPVSEWMAGRMIDQRA